MRTVSGFPAAGGRGPGGGADRLSWWTGSVELWARTALPHEVLSALLHAGVAFRDARVEGDTLRVRVPAGAVRGLRPLLRGRATGIRLADRRGCPFLLSRARRHRTFVAAGLATLVALHLLAARVWFVRVEGADRVPAAEVLAAAARLGLTPGVRRSGVDPARVGRELPLLVPDLAWAGVNLRGVLAVVEVSERVRAAPAYEQTATPGDLVAAESGVVSAMTVLAGTPLVRPGDRVHRGQVLIAGRALLPVARSRSSGLEGLRETPVHASGAVLVRHWYAAYAETARTVPVEVPTGRVYTRLVLVLGQRRLYLAGWRPVPFRHYLLVRAGSGPVLWRKVPLPVETLTLRYVELRRYLRRLSVDDARAVAAAEARVSLLPRLPARARILEERERAVLLPGDRVGVELLVESEENVAVFRARGREAAQEGDMAPAAALGRPGAG